MGRVRVPFSGSSGKPGRHATPKRGKRTKGSKGSGWALLGIAASLAAAWTLAALRLGRSRKTSRTLLQGMLAKPMLVTDHGACRMDCRHIPKSEIMEALAKGSVNGRKSNPREQPCPKYVVDARVGREAKNIQAVFSACRDTTKLVTVIDRDYDWDCYCP